MGSALSPLQRRDATVAVVGFTSWAAVAWKISREHTARAGLAESTLAAGAALLCLWPLALRLAPAAAYLRWREFLVPTHLALQHWIRRRFYVNIDAKSLLGTPGWARGMLPVFLATFCQPWLYLAFGACLQRTRLRTFLWTQPLLLLPMLWSGPAHCAGQLAVMPESAAHLQRIAAAMNRCTAWLPVGPQLGLASSGGGGAPERACLAVHFWLVLLLSFCVPAIVFHRLEGQERHAAKGSKAGDARQLLLQHQPSLLSSTAEVLLAAYASWLVMQVALPLLLGWS